MIKETFDLIYSFVCGLLMVNVLSMSDGHAADVQENEKADDAVNYGRYVVSHCKRGRLNVDES